MALSVDYSTAPPWLITVPKSDLTLITGTQYQLTVDDYWILLRDYTDNEVTMARPVLYSRIPATPSTPSITDIDLNYYRIEFEPDLYSVNIINGNTNIRDGEVKNITSVNTNNTTGYSTVATGSGLDAGQDAKLTNMNSAIDSNLKTVEGMASHAMMMRSIWAVICGLAEDADTGGPITETTTRIAYIGMDDSKQRVIFDVVNLFGTRTGHTLDMSP